MPVKPTNYILSAQKLSRDITKEHVHLFGYESVYSCVASAFFSPLGKYKINIFKHYFQMYSKVCIHC